jgi:hypothetical protein
MPYRLFVYKRKTTVAYLGVLESLCVAVEARAGARLLARETAVLMHHGISGAI